MHAFKLKIAGAMLLAMTTIATGTGVLAYRASDRQQPEPRREPALRMEAKNRKQPPQAPVVRQNRPDRYGDPLPAGAVARLGTVRLRHSDWVESVAVSPDGKTVASGSWDQTIKLWDAATGKELRRLTGHTAAVFSVCFTPDGKTLVSGDNDGMARVWSLETGKELRSFEAHEGSQVRCVAVSPDGRFLATGGGGNSTRVLVLWDLASGKELWSPGIAAYGVLCVAFSPDGKTVATGSNRLGRFGAPPLLRPEPGGCLVQLWDAATGKELRTFEGHANGVSGVAFAPDGKRLASASHDGTIRLWDTATGKQILKAKLPPGPPYQFADMQGGHDRGGLYAIAFSPDGRILATPSFDGTVRLWDAATGEGTRVMSGHAREVHAVAFSPDGKTLVSGSWDNTIRLWDSATGKLLHPFVGHDGIVNALTVAANGKMAASAASDHAIRLWDLVTGQELRVLRGHTNQIMALAFSPNDKLLVSAAQDGTVRFWDPARGEEVRLLRLPNQFSVVAAWSPDGTSLATLSSARNGTSNILQLWDPRTGNELHKIERQWKALGPIVFAPDGKTLAVVGIDRTQILEVPGGKELRRLEYRSSFAFAFFPNGNKVAVRGKGNWVNLYNLAPGKDLYAFGRADELDRPLVLSPDARTLIRATNDGKVRLWEVATAQERLLLAGHAGNVLCAAFCPDGKKLLTGSKDTSILVWDFTRLATR